MNIQRSSGAMIWRNGKWTIDRRQTVFRVCVVNAKANRGISTSSVALTNHQMFTIRTILDTKTQVQMDNSLSSR